MILNDCSAEYSTIESGVPQGSAPGHLLLLIYTSYLEKNIKCNVKFFAGDTMLFSIVNDANDVNDAGISANDLNHDLHVTNQWATSVSNIH